VARRQRDELSMSAEEKRVGGDGECASPHLDEAREGCSEVAFAAGVEDFELQPQRVSGLLQLARLIVGIRIIRVEVMNSRRLIIRSPHRRVRAASAE
jgi:hypothetical protein